MKTVKAKLGSAMLMAIIGTVCVARVAAADLAPEIAGRWVSQDAKLTLDMAPCGKGWCGIVVTGDTCGHTALRVTEGPKDAMYRTFKHLDLVGRLQLAANSESYAVRANFFPDDKGGPPRLSIAGHTGASFAPFRRRYDYMNLLVRNGDAVCAPDPKTS